MTAGECSRVSGASPPAVTPEAAAPEAAAPASAVAADGVLHRYNNIIKSPEDKRVYRGLELVNHMKVLLVSDPTTDKAAAALDVNVGYMSDPDELPGLAHFCEHMLFLGTEKYPEENEYSKYLAAHGGMSNASTSADHTTFYFDVLAPHLAATLDIFAQFFVAPLFTASASARELSAVHSEHEKNLASDVWRLEQLSRATADPRHAYHKFGTGSRDTLETVPKQKGIDVRAELLRFHRRWYSANIMALVVVGRESLDELEALAAALFAGVADRAVEAPHWAEHPLPAERLRKRVYCEPVKDLRTLSVDFPIPDTRRHYKSAPGHYVSHLLGHEGPGSLLSALKARGWCNSLVGGSRLGARGFGFFGVQVDLTEEGVEHVDDIVSLVFQYTAMLRAAGPQRWVWDEQRELMALDFRFRDLLEPRTLAVGYVHQLQEFPAEDVLSAHYLLSEWRPDLVEEMLELLSPERVRIAVVAKCFAERCTQTEPWYGTKYVQEDIEEEKIKEWGAVKPPPELHLPPPNEYIPTRLDLETEPDATTEAVAPIILKDSPLLRVWFKRDDEFRLPKACVTVELASPLAYASPRACCLATLWALLLRDQLQQHAYAAELASLRWSVGHAKHGLSVSTDGYDDKQAALLLRALRAALSFRAAPARFAVLKEAHDRALRNFAAEQPYQHAVYQQALCLSERVWTRGELLDAAQGLTAADLDEWAARAVRAAHAEALVCGNVRRERALRLADDIEALFPKDAVPLLAQQLLPCREVELDKGAWFLRECENSVHRSSCAAVYLSCGRRAARAGVALELLAHALSEPCFHALRTQEQLGYIVFCGVRRSSGEQGLRVLVQGDRGAAFLETRIDAFLDSALELLEGMSAREFGEHRAALAAERLERPKRLAGKAGRMWAEISSQMYDFDRARVEVEELNTVTQEELIAFYKKHIHSSSPERRKLSVHVVSVAEGGAGARADGQAGEQAGGQADGQAAGTARQPTRVTDLVEFKSRRRLHPHPTPAISVPRKGAHCKL